jgi:hypothetical protein
MQHRLLPGHTGGNVLLLLGREAWGWAWVFETMKKMRELVFKKRVKSGIGTWDEF